MFNGTDPWDGNRLVETELAIHIHEGKAPTQREADALGDRDFDVRAHPESEKPGAEVPLAANGGSSGNVGRAL